MKGYLLRVSDPVHGLAYLQSVKQRGLYAVFVTGPNIKDAKVFATRAAFSRFREKHPHITGRLVLLASEMKRRH